MTNNFDTETVRLRQALEELSALNQISNAINALMSVEEITQVIIDHCLRKVKASQGAVFLLQEEENHADWFRTFVRDFAQTDEHIPFHLNESLTGWMLKNRAIFVSNNPSEDERLRGLRLKELQISSILSTPLLSHGGMIGSLVIINKKIPGGFTDDDRRFLGIVGTQTAKVIENARLLEKEKKLISMQRDMELAREIQQRFLPQGTLELPRCAVLGYNLPASDVGGDFYDIIQLDGNRLFFSIGDVVGKGIPASLLMANAQAVLRSHLLKGGSYSLPQLAERLNGLICQFTSVEQYISAVIGIYETDSGRMEYINAGHPAGFIITANGDTVRLEPSDLVIGVLPDYEFRVYETYLQNDDLLLFYSDGVTELFNISEEQFGEERLLEVLHRAREMTLEKLSAEIISTLNQFRREQPRSDDITLLALRRLQ